MTSTVYDLLLNHYYFGYMIVTWIIDAEYPSEKNISAGA